MAKKKEDIPKWVTDEIQNAKFEKPKSEMTPEERVAAARARAKAKREAAESGDNNAQDSLKEESAS